MPLEAKMKERKERPRRRRNVDDVLDDDEEDDDDDVSNNNNGITAKKKCLDIIRCGCGSRKSNFRIVFMAPLNSNQLSC